MNNPIVCPNCQKPILFAWVTGPMIVPPDLCQCPKLPVTSITIEGDPNSACITTKMGGYLFLPKPRTPVPQAFYDAFKGDE